MNPCTLKYSPNEISSRRNYVYQNIIEFLEVNKVYYMTDNDLERIFWFYDKVFLQGSIKYYFQTNPKAQLKITFGNFGQPDQWNNFGPNGEMIETIGISGHSQMEVTSKYKKHTVYISRPIFSSLFQDGRSYQSANGLNCKNQLECLLLTLEHEMVHLIIDLFCDSRKNGHGKYFKELVKNIFGHTDVTHSLGFNLPGKNYLCQDTVVNLDTSHNDLSGCLRLY
jgi:hypothetical protein